VAAFGKGLGETRYVDGRNVTVEYHFLDGRYDRQPAVMADLVRRRVAVIVAGGGEAIALGAKAATTTIPIVFSSGDDPVKLGLARSGRPQGGSTITQQVAKNLLVGEELSYERKDPRNDRRGADRRRPSKVVKIEWTAKKNTVSPYFVMVPDTLKAVGTIYYQEIPGHARMGIRQF
jgi:hypothetical protein